MKWDQSGVPEPAPERSGSTGWFERTPAQLSERLDAIGLRCGKESIEYGALLVELGDSHMRQGCLANPQAQASYEAALEIFRGKGEETAETAWIYDKLANVKQSSGNSRGAETDLTKALAFWKKHPPGNLLATAVNQNHAARRTEDWERLRKLNQFLDRSPPGG